MRVFEVQVQYVPTLWEVSSDRLNTPEKLVAYLRGLTEKNPAQESFWVVHLNTKMNPLGAHLVSIGTVNSTLTHPREVFRSAIVAGATGVCVAHNHPSGDPAPSSADVTVTRQLREASRIIGIELVDHVVIGDASLDPLGRGFYSFRSAGLL